MDMMEMMLTMMMPQQIHNLSIQYLHHLPMHAGLAKRKIQFA
jgi:hypothetical protein